MSDLSLMPDNATPFEVVFSRAINSNDQLGLIISSLHGLKINNPPASFLPYLVWEYGLGELSPYVPNLYDLIKEGIAWQRVRGTPFAVATGLGWLSYEAVIEEAPVRRSWWNQFQLHLNRVRDDEVDLPRIEGIATLSTPMRSDFWRGVHGYDVRATEAGYSRASMSMASDDSGVRIEGGKAKWSFGRGVEYQHQVTHEDLAALGIDDPWALTLGGEQLTLDGEPLRFVPDGGGTRWGGPWLPIPWRSDEVWAASVALLAATGAGPAWAAFKDAHGAILFYRRARIRRSVSAVTAGPYALGGQNYAPAVGSHLYLEALTDFDEGHGLTAASVGWVLSAEPADGFKRGAAHLPAGALDPAGPIIAETPVHIEFGRTVRERVACLLRF